MTIDNSDGFILHFQDISHGGIWGSEKRDENHRSLGCLSRESQHYRRPRSIIDARPNIFNYYLSKHLPICMRAIGFVTCFTYRCLISSP